LAQRVARENEASVAAGCTVADVFALQQHHIAHAAFGEAERQANPGVPATNDRDARSLPAFERRQGFKRASAGGVPGGGRHRASIPPGGPQLMGVHCACAKPWSFAGWAGPGLFLETPNHRTRGGCDMLALEST